MSDAGDSPACLLWSETSPPRDVNAGAFLNASGGREMHRRPLTAWSLDDPVELAWHDKLSLPPLRRSPKAVLVAAVQQDMHGPTPARSLRPSAEKLATCRGAFECDSRVVRSLAVGVRHTFWEHAAVVTHS